MELQDGEDFPKGNTKHNESDVLLYNKLTSELPDLKIAPVTTPDEIDDNNFSFLQYKKVKSIFPDMPDVASPTDITPEYMAAAIKANDSSNFNNLFDRVKDDPYIVKQGYKPKKWNDTVSEDEKYTLEHKFAYNTKQEFTKLGEAVGIKYTDVSPDKVNPNDVLSTINYDAINKIADAVNIQNKTEKFKKYNEFAKALNVAPINSPEELNDNSFNYLEYKSLSNTFPDMPKVVSSENMTIDDINRLETAKKSARHNQLLEPLKDNPDIKKAGYKLKKWNDPVTDDEIKTLEENFYDYTTKTYKERGSAVGIPYVELPASGGNKLEAINFDLIGRIDNVFNEDNKKQKLNEVNKFNKKNGIALYKTWDEYVQDDGKRVDEYNLKKYNSYIADINKSLPKDKKVKPVTSIQDYQFNAPLIQARAKEAKEFEIKKNEDNFLKKVNADAKIRGIRNFLSSDDYEKNFETEIIKKVNSDAKKNGTPQYKSLSDYNKSLSVKITKVSKAPDTDIEQLLKAGRASGIIPANLSTKDATKLIIENKDKFNPKLVSLVLAAAKEANKVKEPVLPKYNKEILKKYGVSEPVEGMGRMSRPIEETMLKSGLNTGKIAESMPDMAELLPNKKMAIKDKDGNFIQIEDSDLPDAIRNAPNTGIRLDYVQKLSDASNGKYSPKTQEEYDEITTTLNKVDDRLRKTSSNNYLWNEYTDKQVNDLVGYSLLVGNETLQEKLKILDLYISNSLNTLNTTDEYEKTNAPDYFLREKTQNLNKFRSILEATINKDVVHSDVGIPIVREKALLEKMFDASFVSSLPSKFNNTTYQILTDEFFRGLETIKYKDNVTYNRIKKLVDAREPIASNDLVNFTNIGASINKQIQDNKLSNGEITTEQHDKNINKIKLSLGTVADKNIDVLQRDIAINISKYYGSKDAVYGDLYRYKYTDEELDTYREEMWGKFHEDNPYVSRKAYDEAFDAIKENETIFPLLNGVPKSGGLRPLYREFANVFTSAVNTLEDIAPTAIGGKSYTEIFNESRNQSIRDVGNQETDLESKRGTPLYYYSKITGGFGQLAGQILLTELAMAPLSAGVRVLGLAGKAGATAELGALTESQMAQLARRGITPEMMSQMGVSATKQSLTGSYIGLVKKYLNYDITREQMLSTFITSGLISYDQHLKEAMRWTDNDATATGVASLMAVVEGLSEMALPNIAMKNKFLLNIKSAGFIKFASKLTLDDIAKGTYKQGLKEIFGKVVKGLGNAATIEITENLEELMVNAVSFGIQDNLAPQTIDRSLAETSLETVKATTLAMTIPALLGFGGALRGNKYTSLNLLATAQNPLGTIDVINKNLADGVITPKQHLQQHAIVRAAVKANRELYGVKDAQGNRLSATNKAVYVYSRTRQQILEKRLDNAKAEGSKSLEQIHQKQINDEIQIQKNALENKNDGQVVTTNAEAALADIEAKKADVEKRRKEELGVVSSAIAASERTGEVPAVNGELVSKKTIEEINDKHDAELSTLETQKQEIINNQKNTQENATTQKQQQQQEGTAKDNLGQREGAVQGQQKDGKGKGEQRSTENKGADNSDSNQPSEEQKVAELRAAEQAELDTKIPNAEQYRVNGKVDRTKLTNDTDRKAFDEVYSKYDKLITPILEGAKPKTVFDSLPVGIKASEGQPTSKSHAPLFAAAKKSLSALNEIFHNLDIHFHENSDDFQKVLDVTAGGRKASTTDGNFAYIKDKDGNYTVRIDINLSNPNASVTTVIHEAIHPILLSEFGENPKYFEYLKNQVAKSVGFTKNIKLKKFIKAYSDIEQPEEYLVQLGAILKDKEKIEPNVFRRIAEAINKIVLRVTKGKFKPFENVKDSNETVRYFSSLVEAIRTGDLSKTKLRSQSQEAGRTGVGSKQSRGGLTATDMKSMTVADNGDLLFFHYGDIKGSKVDARKGTPKAYTTDKRVYTTNYYYTNESDREGMVSGKVNVVRVPADKVYSFNKDVLGLFDEAKKNSEAQSKGQAFSPNRQADFIAQLAAKNGFDMMVAKWGNGYRAESPKALPIDAALTKQMRTNGSLSTAAVDDKLNQDIYNAAASKANGNSEKYRSAFYGIKDITAKDIMEHPILSRGIPKRLADKYNGGQVRSKQSLNAGDKVKIEGVSVTIPNEAQQDLLKQERTAKSYFDEKVRLMEPSPLSKEEIKSILNRDDIAILTGTNPDGNAVADNTNNLLNKKAEDWLKRNGYTYHQVTGKYGQTESSFLVEGMTGNVALEFAKIFKQDSVLQSEGLIYREGTIEKRIADGDAFGLDVTEPDADYVSAIKTNTGEVVGFQFGIDLGNKVQYEVKSKQSKTEDALKINSIEDTYKKYHVVPQSGHTKIDVNGSEPIKKGQTFGTVTYSNKEEGDVVADSFSVNDIDKLSNRSSGFITTARNIAQGFISIKPSPKDITEQLFGKGKNYKTLSDANKAKVDKERIKQTTQFKLPWSNNKSLTSLNEYINKNKDNKPSDYYDVVKQKSKDIINSFKEEVKNNLRALYNNVSEDFKETSRQWYDGANRLAQSVSNSYGISLEQSAGILAALSPKNNWFNNISAAERVIRAWADHQDTTVTQEMVDRTIAYMERNGEAPFAKNIRTAFAKTKGQSISELTKEYKKTGAPEILEAIGITMRIIDQSEYSPIVYSVSPEGFIDGKYGVIGWSGGAALTNAVSMLIDPSMKNISSRLGNGNKVRNFYGNIIDPQNAEFLTADTHAFAAGLMLPSSANEAQDFGLFDGGMSVEYAIFKDAYTEVAKEIGILPRELQSITWEAVRGSINTDNRTPSMVKDINKISEELLNNGESNENRTNEILKKYPIKFSKGEWSNKRGIVAQATVLGGDEALQQTTDTGRGTTVLGNLRGQNAKVGSRTSTVGSNQIKSKQSRTEDAKSAYETKLEENLEQLRDAYGNARKADTGVRKIKEDSPTSVGNFIKRLINGATPEAAAEAKAKLVEMQRKYRKEKAEMRAMLPRERGVNFVIEKISRAARNGDITQDEADLAIDLLRKSPSLFGDLAISITIGNKKANGDGIQGWYRAADELVKIFKNPKDPLTVTHELLHHTERFLPQEVRDGIIKEWHAQVQRQAADIASKLKTETDTDTRQQLTQALLYLGLAEARQLEPDFFNAMAMENIMKKYLADHTDSKGNFNKGLGDSWYQLYNPSEWWAVNASKIFSDAKNKPALKTWTDKAKAFYNYLIDSIKKVFKGNPIANVEKGLKAILEGNTLENIEGNMLADSKQSLNIKQKESFEERNQIKSKQSRTEDALKDVESTAKALENIGNKKLEKTGIDETPTARDVDYGGITWQQSGLSSFNKGSDGKTYITDKDGNVYSILKTKVSANGTFLVSVKDTNGKEVGNFEFKKNKDGSFSAQEAYVSETRKGLASIAYDFASQEGVIIKPSNKLKSDGIKFWSKSISEAYHEAKQDGSNPELVKAVEEAILGKVLYILNDTFNQEAKKTKIDKLDIKALAKKVVDIVKSSKLYEQTDDIERDNAIIDFLKSKGIVQKRVIEPRNKNIISVNEVTALKDQIRLEIKAANDGAKSIEDAVKKIGEIIKGLAKGKKISVTSAKALINKFSNMNTANKDSVNSVLDYAEKIFNDAEYADKVAQVRALNSAMKKAASNNAIPPDTRSIALSFSKINPEAVSDIDAHLEAAKKIKDALVGVKENGVKIRKAIDINAMAEYLKTAMTEQDTYDAKNPTTTRVVEPLDEEKALEYLTAEHDSLLQAVKALVPSAVLTDAEMAQLKNFLKLSIDDFETMEDKIAAVEALDNFVKNADMGKIPFILNNQQVNANIKKGVAVVLPKLKSASFMRFSEIKSIFRGWLYNKFLYKDATDFNKELAYFMSQAIRRLDNLIGNFKTYDVFNNTFKAMASGYAKFIFKIKSMEADIIFQKVLSSFNGDMEKAVKHCYKMTMYKLQLEYESNIGNKEVIPAIKHLEKTLESGNLTEKDKAELRKLIEKFSIEDPATGEKKIDTKKIWDSFSKVEQQAAVSLAELYEKLRPYAKHVAVSLRGVAFNPRVNYMMLNVISQEESLADLPPSDLKSRFIQGSTKAGTINARDGQAHAISLDPYNTFNTANRDIMMDYCLLNPIKTVTAIFNKLVEDTAGDEKANNVARSLRYIFDEITKSIITRSLVQSDDIMVGVLDYVKKVGARYMLSKPSKAAGEFAGNLAYAIIAYGENVIEGMKNNSLQRNFKLTKVMEVLNSYSIDRLHPHKGDSGAYLNPNSFDIDVRDKKHFIDGFSNAAQMVYYNSLLKAQKFSESISDALMSVPDLSIGRFTWEGTLRLTFKKETGLDIDMDKIAEKDYDYLDKYKDALEKATTEADRVVAEIANTKNPFAGIGKEGARRGNMSELLIINGYMTSFTKTENQNGIDAAYAIAKGGKKSRIDGIRTIAAIAVRSGVYLTVKYKVQIGLLAAAYALMNAATGDDDSEEKRRRRAKAMVDYLTVENPKIQGSITGIKDNVNMGNALMTSDTKFIESAKKDAAPEESMLHLFTKGMAQAGVNIILGRNSGSFYNSLVTAPLVDGFNEKFIHPAISSEPYNKYRDGLMYSKLYDPNRQDPELNFIVDNSGAFQPFMKASITAVRTFYDKYGSELAKVEKKIEDHERGVSMARDEATKAKYYELVKRRDDLKEKEKSMKSMTLKNMIVGIGTATSVLPAGKEIDVVLDRVLKNEKFPNDWDEIVEKFKESQNYEVPVTMQRKNSNSKDMVLPEVYQKHILQGYPIPAKKP